jgi:predicted ATPase
VGYKSLDPVELKFDDLTVIVGPNAAGKSNLLDAINLLGRLGTSVTLNEAFQGHRGTPIEAFTVGPGGIAEVISAKRTARFTLTADVHLDDPVVKAVETEIAQMREGLPEQRSGPLKRMRIFERDIRYEVTVEIRADTGLLRVVDERIAPLRADGQESQSRKPYLEKMGPRLSLRMEGQSHPTYYDIGLDHTVLSRPLYPPHYPHITALREELRRWRVYYFDPETLRSDSALKQVTMLSARGGDLPAFVNTLQSTNPNGYRSFVQALKFIIPAVESVSATPTQEGVLSLTIQESGIPFSARVVSEGTLRVLGLLAITQPASPATVVAYEEPENGVHPRRLRLIAELLRRAADKKHVQLIINTQSALLPEFLFDARLYSCTKERGLSHFSSLPSGPFAKGEAEAALMDTGYHNLAMSGEFGG